MNRLIESTKTVYLDGEEYVRVFFEGSEYFEDVHAGSFESWKEATGNYEKKVTPSQQCKQAGLKSLAELVEATATSEQTLINWQRNKPKLFAVVVAGAVALRGA